MTTVPHDDPAKAGETFARLEGIGYDAGLAFEAKHDPFLAVAAASQHTSTMALGTAIAIGFARNPMNLANIGWDLQAMSGGRFILGLGTQVKPHIERRFSSVWSRPVARLREQTLAIRAIWHAWETGEKLQFEGEFYTHTIMIPAFNPGPNPFGPPPIYLAGYGPKMVEMIGEVGDGLFVHPFNSAESLRAETLPALERGLATAGRVRSDIDVVAATIVVTGASDDEESFERSRETVRSQLAFYGSTPAYRRVLDVHGWGDLHPRLNEMSKRGEWTEMATLIDDEMLETIAVVGERHEIAPKLRARLDGLADAVSLTNNRCPDPSHWADVVEAWTS